MRVIGAMGIMVVLASGAALGAGCAAEEAAPSPIEPMEVSWLRVLKGYDSLRADSHSFAIDRDGNVTVAVGDAGGCYELRKLARDGAELWRRPFADPAPAPARCPTRVELTVDRDGNILAFGSSYTGHYPDYDFFVRKHGPQGDVLWTRYHEAATDDLRGAIAADRAGNIVAAGATARDTPPRRASWMTRYAPDGTPQWVQESDVEAEWQHLQIDSADNLLAVRRLPVGNDLVLHKLDPAGNPIWELSLPHQIPLFWADIASHPDGWSVALLPDNKLLKIDAAGHAELEIQVPGSFVSPDGFPGTAATDYVAIAPDGTIVAAGLVWIERCADGACTSNGIVIHRYSPDGVLLSRRLIERSGDLDLGGPSSLAVDGSGQIVLIGVGSTATCRTCMAYVAAVAAE
jgi:hypothetical protein